MISLTLSSPINGLTQPSKQDFTNRYDRSEYPPQGLDVLFSNENGVGADLSDELEGHFLKEFLMKYRMNYLMNYRQEVGVDDWQFQHRKQHPVAFTGCHQKHLQIF